MQKLLILLLISLLTACASRTQIHVFSLGIDDQVIANLSSELVQQGFDVRPNSLPVPASIVRHTIVFPAIVQDFVMIEQVETAMAQAGYANPRLILESEANHSYSTSNIGIYLVDPNYDHSVQSQVDPYLLGDDTESSLTYNYFSECPESSEAQSELNLYPAGTAILEQFIWDEDKGNEISVLNSGEWVADSTTVSINMFKAGELRFSITRHTGSNWFGPYEGLTLENQYSSMNIESCNYTHLKYPE